MMVNYLIILVLHIVVTSAKIYFKEEFTDDDWQKRWIVSQHPSKEWGKFVLSPGKYYGDPEISKGIQTAEDKKFYSLTRKFEPFSNKDKVLVIQYSVKYEQNIKCGGAYIKLFDCNFEPKKFHSYKPYLIQFGPDICGYKKVHVIFNYNDRKLAMKQQLNCKDDRFTHLYTLVIKPDNSYLIKIDNKIVRRGMLEEDWDFLPSRMINDKKIKKTLDWNDTLIVADIKGEKSQDWNQVDPDFNFIEEQNSKDIKLAQNRDNNDEWKMEPNDSSNNKEQRNEPVIQNLEQYLESNFYEFEEICGIGFDLWQVESGTLFDNILITDDEFEAEKTGNVYLGMIKEKEFIMKIKFDKLVGKVTENGHWLYHEEL